MANASQSKRAVRVATLKAVRDLAPALRQEFSASLCARLLPVLASRRFPALFAPRWDEPDLRRLGDGLFRPGQTVLFPRIEGGDLVFAEGSWAELIPGRFGIPAPAGPPCPTPPDVVLVPGVAFSRRGDRLGRGHGFYDRYLATLPPASVSIGVCFSVQLLTEIPCDEGDARVDFIQTEREMIRTRT